MRDIHTPHNSRSKKARSSNAAEDDMPHLDTQQLMSVVRRGAQTLARPAVDINQMLNWDWETTLAECKDKPSDVHVAAHTQQGREVDEQAETKWLSEIEAVSSCIFEGKKYEREKQRADDAWAPFQQSKEARRVGKNTTVMVDGHAVNKESMRCKDWEAVPTMAGTDPRLAERKREKKADIVNQAVSSLWRRGR